MKKLLVTAAMMVLAAGAALAQNYMIVNSETIFKAIDDYNKVVLDIDEQAQAYQKNIDEAYEKIEQQYNDYMEKRASMSQADQQKHEDAIINNEKKVAEYQEKVFGNEGTIAKIRTEKLEPIQKKVFEAIADYAKKNGFDLALDVATNPMVVYYNPELDKTQQIIALLK